MSIIFGVMTLAFIYGIIALPTIIALRATDKNFVRNNPVVLDDNYFNQAQQGFLPSQIVSFIFSIILTIITIGIFAMLLVQDGLIVFVLLALVAFTYPTIVANIFWVYPKKVRYAEAYAIVHKQTTGFFKFQRVLTWVIWSIYTIGAAVILILSAPEVFNSIHSFSS